MDPSTGIGRGSKKRPPPEKLGVLGQRDVNLPGNTSGGRGRKRQKEQAENEDGDRRERGSVAERSGRDLDNDPNEPDSPISEVDEDWLQEILDSLDEDVESAPPPIESTDEQFRRNLEDIEGTILLKRGYEKVKLDTINVMWRSKETSGMGYRGRKAELKYVEKEIASTWAKLVNGLAGRKSHTWICEYISHSGNRCNDPNVCWEQKYGTIVQRARETDDWTELLHEFETNVVFILSKWNTFVKHGSKAFPTFCFPIFKQFIRDHWARLQNDLLTFRQAKWFRVQLRDEVAFLSGITPLEAQSYVNSFLGDVATRKEEGTPWETCLEEFAYKFPQVYLPEVEKEIIRQRTLNNLYHPYFSKKEQNEWTGRTGIEWKQADNYLKIYLSELEKLPAYRNHRFFRELKTIRIRNAKKMGLLPYTPIEVVEELLLPREEVVDVEREEKRDRRLARRNIFRSPGLGLPVGHPHLLGAP